VEGSILLPAYIIIYRTTTKYQHYLLTTINLEQTAAKAIAKHYKIELKCIAISGCHIADGYIPARNSFLLSLALMNFKYTHGVIAIGIHAGTPYSDCSPLFKDVMQELFDLYENGRIRIDAPFLTWKKSEIWDYAQLQKVPLHLTHSNNLEDLQPIADYLKED